MIVFQDFMKHLWIPNVFVYNLVSFKALDCLKKLAGLWIVNDRDLFYNQVSFQFQISSVKNLCVENDGP
jgi:hypothetical protein